MLNDDDTHMSKQPTPAASGTAGDKRAWECSAPEISIQHVDDEQMPEMPNLESVWAKSFQSVRNDLFYPLMFPHIYVLVYFSKLSFF